jgi:hypothetical protein
MSDEKKEKRETWPKHKMGKHCGYSLHKDGSIEVAPGYADAMAQIQKDRKVIDELMQSAIRACDSLMRPLVERQNKLWDDMLGDYGLVRSDGWTLSNRILKRATKERA